MKINIKFDNVEMLMAIILGHMLFLFAHCLLEVGQTKCGCDDTDFFLLLALCHAYCEGLIE